VIFAVRRGLEPVGVLAGKERQPCGSAGGELGHVSYANVKAEGLALQ
jgi:hypothetical protein